MHTFTEEADPRINGFCTNCHDDELDNVSSTEEDWLEHSMKGRVSRNTMDRVEIDQLGSLSGDPDTNNDGIWMNSPEDEHPRRTLCRSCHDDEWREVQCDRSDGREWKEHLTEGRVSMKVWELVSQRRTNSTCGW
jgi:hypothetical protein